MVKIMNKKWIISNCVASSKSNGGDDFIAIKHFNDEFKLFFLADGATGAGNGKAAAKILYDICVKELFNCKTFDEVTSKMSDTLLLADKEIKQKILYADTTAILLAVQEDKYAISSVGDSEAWMISGSTFKYLTYQQRKKPRIGSGAKIPLVDSGTIEGPILIFSDGLRHALPEHASWFKYSHKPDNWANLLLLDALDKWSNELPDDLSVITATYQ